MLDKKNMSKRHFRSLEDQSKFADTLEVPHAHILQIPATFDSPHILENWLRLLRLHTPMFDSFQSYNFSNASFTQLVHREESLKTSMSIEVKSFILSSPGFHNFGTIHVLSQIIRG